MHRSLSSGLVALLVLLSTACSRRLPPSTDASANGSPSTAATTSAASTPVRGGDSGVDSAAPPVLEARGSATLVIQHVEAVCIVGVGSNGKGHFSVGTDLLVETVDEGGGKPVRDFVSCPKRLPDGGTGKPHLGSWQNCKAYPSCNVVSAEGGTDRVEVLCGADRFTLESVGGRTLLRGSSGDREIAPIPMKIATPKKENRNAMVDC